MNQQDSTYKRLVFIFGGLLLLALLWIVLKPEPTNDKEVELEKQLTASKARESQLMAEREEYRSKVSDLETEKFNMLIGLREEREHHSTINPTFDETHSNVTSLPLDESIEFFADWTTREDSI